MIADLVHINTLTLGTAAWRFATPGVLPLLVVVPLIAIGMWYAFLRQRRALALLSGRTPQSTRPSSRRAIAKIATTAAGAASLIVALARPQSDPTEQESIVRGRDIAFLVDVSRSMLSRDVVPSRLERAKLWIKDLTKTLRGDRVALVAFAGVPVVQSPLTLDYGYLGMALDELSPESSPRGGTLIGDAIRKTMSDVFEPGASRFRDIILITDGEDQESFPVEAATKAGELGVRIIAIGVGSELAGAPVPAKEGSGQKFLEYEGRQVQSRMDASGLAKIADAAARARGDAGGGVFLNVGTGTVDLERVYRDLIATAEQQETQTKAATVYRELFPYFLGLALAFLAMEPLIGLRRRSTPPRLSAGAAAAMIAACVTATVRAQPPESPAATPPAAPAPRDASSLYNAGRELFLSGKYAEAGEAFRDADRDARDPELSARARFNLGQSLLKLAAAEAKADPSKAIPKLDEAARAFRGALAVNPNDTDAARNVELARRLMKDAQKRQSEQQPQSGENDPKNQDKNTQDKNNQDQSSKNGNPQSKQGPQSQDKQSGQNNPDAQKHQDNADALKDLAERQSKAADASRDAQDQNEQAAKDAKTQQAQKDQRDVNKDTDQKRRSMDDGKDASQQAKEQLDQARKEQEAAQQALEKGDPKSAEKHQRQAAEMLKQASQAEQAAADQARQNAQDAKDQEPKRDETASQLLDKERKQREARQKILRALKGRPQPVERDW